MELIPPSQRYSQVQQPCLSLSHSANTMKRMIILGVLLVRTAFTGESGLTVTHQPLDGLGSGTIHLAQVTCHDWYAMSGTATQVGLISAPNIPPSNNPKEATEDLNLASVCGVRFLASDIGDANAALELTLDATKFLIPKRHSHPPEHVIRACLECLRRCLPDKMIKTPLTLRSAEGDKGWMTKIVSEFNAHDRTKVFFTPPS